MPRAPSSPLLRRLVLTALAALGALLGFVLLVALFQERLVWQPPSYRGAERLGGEARRVDYVAADGQRLFGYVVPPPVPLAPLAPLGSEAPARGATERVLVAFHGNAETAAMSLDWAREVATRTGWTVFLPEYRGYAGLPGRPTYAGSQADARAAHAYVRDSLGVPADHIGVFGFSLGSAVAAELASEVRPAVLLLQAPFTSARDMTRAGVLRPVGLLWRWISRVHFDTRARVAEVDAPVWVIHGRDDFIIPVRMGHAVHAAARVQGQLVTVPGAGHNDLPSTGGARYWRWLEDALADVVRTTSP